VPVSNDAAAFQYHDPVSAAHRRKTMRDHGHGAVLHQVLESSLLDDEIGR
jgi:hypothetical protein